MILRTLGQQLVGRPHSNSDEPIPPTNVADQAHTENKVEALTIATRTREVVSIGVSAYARATLSPLDRARVLQVMEDAIASRRAQLEDGDNGGEELGPTIAGSRFLRELRHRDTVVHLQAAAYRARAQNYGSQTSYEYEFGSDGHRYATGGEVCVATNATEEARPQHAAGAEWVEAATDELVRTRLNTETMGDAVKPEEFVGSRSS